MVQIKKLPKFAETAFQNLDYMKVNNPKIAIEIKNELYKTIIDLSNNYKIHTKVIEVYYRALGYKRKFVLIFNIDEKNEMI
ncbi:MAG: hypothetical protein IJ770_03880 [Alphaproteobacteria bacterium]|nr:hypothetical protein [Alphaproteobacteria bacterium]